MHAEFCSKKIILAGCMHCLFAPCLSSPMMVLPAFLPHIILLQNDGAPLYSGASTENHSDVTITPGSLQRQDRQVPGLPTCMEWKTTKILTGFSNQRCWKDPFSMCYLPGSAPAQCPQFQRVTHLGPVTSNSLQMCRELELASQKRRCCPMFWLAMCPRLHQYQAWQQTHLLQMWILSSWSSEMCSSAESLGHSHPIIQRFGNTISKLLASCTNLDISFEDYKLDSKLIFHSLLLLKPPLIETPSSHTWNHFMILYIMSSASVDTLVLLPKMNLKTPLGRFSPLHSPLFQNLLLESIAYSKTTLFHMNLPPQFQTHPSILTLILIIIWLPGEHSPSSHSCFLVYHHFLNWLPEMYQRHIADAHYTTHNSQQPWCTYQTMSFVQTPMYALVLAPQQEFMVMSEQLGVKSFNIWELAPSWLGLMTMSLSESYRNISRNTISFDLGGARISQLEAIIMMVVVYGMEVEFWRMALWKNLMRTAVSLCRTFLTVHLAVRQMLSTHITSVTLTEFLKNWAFYGSGWRTSHSLSAQHTLGLNGTSQQCKFPWERRKRWNISIPFLNGQKNSHTHSATYKNFMESSNTSASSYPEDGLTSQN